MARKKVPLRYIGNGAKETSRRRAYETRRKNLMKKAREMGILCNTKACVVVYDEGASAPDVYPSHAEAVAILNRYKDTPNMPRFKKVVTQEEVLTQRVAKLRHEADKLRREREDRETRMLLHKAMRGGNLNVEEVARVGSKLEEILKSLGERIAKNSMQPPVFQPQAPYGTGSVDIPAYQVPLPQQQQGPQPPVFQPQAPYVTGNVDMGPSPTYQMPPPPQQQQQGWQPPVFQPQAPHVTGSADMGPLPTYQVQPQQHHQGWKPSDLLPQEPYVTGNVAMGAPRMYQAPPPQQEGWLDTGRSEGNHDALLYNANSTGAPNGTATSSSAGFPFDDLMQFFDDMGSEFQ
ncbi:hypothetical protein ZWY2020_009373 [Hordeum vulgare]|nr:hypothetical protein ZWY2020_009373 [Hordeum vulgare]